MARSEKIAILDVDGTLLNWRNHFETWALQHDLINEPDPYDFRFSPKGGIDMVTIINIFNETFHISRLAPEDGAVKAVRKLHEAGFTLKICSSFSSKYDSMKMREENLENVFGKVFAEYNFVPFIDFKHTADKIKYIEENAKYGDVHLFEDNHFLINEVMERNNTSDGWVYCHMIPQSFNDSEITQQLKLKGVVYGGWDFQMKELFGE